jgi:hypothetical protein
VDQLAQQSALKKQEEEVEAISCAPYCPKRVHPAEPGHRLKMAGPWLRQCCEGQE